MSLPLSGDRAAGKGRPRLRGRCTLGGAARLGMGALLVLGVGCNREPAGGAPAGPVPLVSFAELAADDRSGLSGLAADERGVLWTVPERQPFLVEIPGGGARPRSIPVRGVPDGLELEALAWLGQDRFAIGTEAGCHGGAERILLVRRDGAEARVEGTIELSLTIWPAPCDLRHGIEGLCHAGGQLVVALEQALDPGQGGRVAPVARIDLATGKATPFRVALTSATGKLSALECRARGDTLEVVAIERHFEVSRVLGFALPAAGPADPSPLRARVLFDLASHTRGGKRNFEGVVWRDEHRLVLITDNHYGKVTGPSEMAEAEPGAP